MKILYIYLVWILVDTPVYVNSHDKLACIIIDLLVIIIIILWTL